MTAGASPFLSRHERGRASRRTGYFSGCLSGKWVPSGFFARAESGFERSDALRSEVSVSPWLAASGFRQKLRPPAVSQAFASHGDCSGEDGSEQDSFVVPGVQAQGKRKATKNENFIKKPEEQGLLIYKIYRNCQNYNIKCFKILLFFLPMPVLVSDVLREGAGASHSVERGADNAAGVSGTLAAGVESGYFGVLERFRVAGDAHR